MAALSLAVTSVAEPAAPTQLTKVGGVAQKRRLTFYAAVSIVLPLTVLPKTATPVSAVTVAARLFAVTQAAVKIASAFELKSIKSVAQRAQFATDAVTLVTSRGSSVSPTRVAVPQRVPASLTVAPPRAKLSYAPHTRASRVPARAGVLVAKKVVGAPAVTPACVARQTVATARAPLVGVSVVGILQTAAASRAAAHRRFGRLAEQTVRPTQPELFD